jgi:hypothetical protein
MKNRHAANTDSLSDMIHHCSITEHLEGIIQWRTRTRQHIKVLYLKVTSGAPSLQRVHSMGLAALNGLQRGPSGRIIEITRLQAESFGIW